MNDMQRRVIATTATDKRFRNIPFDWGKAATCIHLMQYHARKMGHRMPKVPRFRSAFGARKRLESMGYKSVVEVMDAYFERIPVSFMLPGDIMAIPGDGGFECLCIKGERQKFLGWHESAEGCTIMEADVNAALGAWRL